MGFYYSPDGSGPFYTDEEDYIPPDSNVLIYQVVRTGEMPITFDINTPLANQLLFYTSGGVWVNRKPAFGNYDSGNYTEFENDGTMVSVGDAVTWEDANVGAVILFGPAATKPTETEIKDSTGTGTGIWTLGFDVGEKGSGFIEVPHAAKDATAISFHIHWCGNDAPTGTDYVRWRLTYTISGENELVSAVGTVEVETAYDTQYKRVTSTFANITTSGMKQLGFTLERVASTGDAYAGQALPWTLGFHYAQDTLGSRTITAK